MKNNSKVVLDLVNAARCVVGGVDINGYCVEPASVRNLSKRLLELEDALKNYDRAVISAKPFEVDDGY